jgi:hypothetical protein
MLADHRAKVLMFPPHTTHIFQSIDLSPFGNFKKRMNSRLPLETDERTTGFSKRIFHVMKRTLVEDHVRGSFMQFGLTYDINTIPYALIFDEHVLRQSPGFTSSGFRNEITLLRKSRVKLHQSHLKGYDILSHLTNDHCWHCRRICSALVQRYIAHQ